MGVTLVAVGAQRWKCTCVIRCYSDCAMMRQVAHHVEGDVWFCICFVWAVQVLRNMFGHQLPMVTGAAVKRAASATNSNTQIQKVMLENYSQITRCNTSSNYQQKEHEIVNQHTLP